MAEKNDWWTAPAESENGKIIMVTGRRDIEKFRDKGRFPLRVTVAWKYESNSLGFPSEETSRELEAVTEAFHEYMNGSVSAVMTGIYTGEGLREWIFYATNPDAFTRRLNIALESFPLLPIKISAENDPNWEEYSEMKEASEIQA